MGGHVVCSSYMGGKIRFSGARKPVVLKTNSRECCVPRNSMHLVTLQGTFLIVYFLMQQVKYVMER